MKMESYIEENLRLVDGEVKTYKDSRGLVTVELFYLGVVQTKLSRSMIIRNLMLMAMEHLEDN